MNFQPALDHINMEALRTKRDVMDAEIAWWPATDGDGVSVTATWPDGFTATGYAPLAMRDIRASYEPTLRLVK